MNEHSSPGVVGAKRAEEEAPTPTTTKRNDEIGTAETIGTSSENQRKPTSMPPAGRWSTARLPVVDRRSYAVSGEVAQGGIGRVLAARDARLDRDVALKELLDAGGASEDRFVREALLTARLQHPSIVPVYEAGRWPSGEPFYSMKLVSGRPLSDIIDAALSLDDRLPLLTHVLAVAEAVAYAHGKRIIHRDLKPANVLVGEYGETIVIDWGLAKDLTDKTPEPSVAPTLDDTEGGEGLTIMGSVMGTPAYMPPEQAAGEAVDERADVYALGAILHHVLAGHAPYAGASGVKILGMVLAGPPKPLRQVMKGIPLDLLAIVGKAMAREPAERYPTAKALAEDLRRCLAGQLVGAHRYSARERAFRFVRKHRSALAVAVAAVCLLAMGGALGVSKIVAERDRATYERHLAEAAHHEAAAAEHIASSHADELTLVEARDAAAHDPNEALAWLKTLSPSFSEWSAARVIAADAWAHGPARVLRDQTEAINNIDVSRDGRLLAAASDDHTARVYDLVSGTSRAFVGHDDEVWSVAIIDDDRRLVTTSKDKTIRIWDIATGAHLTTLRGHERAVFMAAASADGRRLYSISDDTSVREWDLATGAGRVLVEGPEKSAKAAFSPDGQHYVAAGERGAVYVHTFENDKPILIEGMNVTTSRALVGAMFPMRWSKDGQALVVGNVDGSVRVWDMQTEKTRVLGSLSAPIIRVTFSPDGRDVAAAATGGGGVALFHLETGAPRVLAGHEAGVSVIAYSPDGRTFVSGGLDRVVRVFDLETGLRRELVGMRDTIMAMRFSPDGKRLIVANADATIRIYPLDAAPGSAIGHHTAPVLSLDVSPQGDRVVAADKSGAVWVWPAKGGGAGVLLEGHHEAVLCARFSPDGDTLATASVDGTVRLWDLQGHEVRALDTGAAGPTRMTYSHDGAWLGIGDAAGGVWLWSVDSGEARVLGHHERSVRDLAFSHDGRRLATASGDRTTRVWDLVDGGERVLSGFDDTVVSVAYSPDDRILAMGSFDHKLRLWDGMSAAPRAVDSGGFEVSNLFFSPDGSTLVSTGDDAAARVWDVEKGGLSRMWRGHAGTVWALALSSDGATGVTGGNDKTVRLWDVKSGESRVLGVHGGVVRAVALAPDGSWAASAGEDGAIRVWNDDLPRQPAELRAWIDASTPDTMEMLMGRDQRVR